MSVVCVTRLLWLSSVAILLSVRLSCMFFMSVFLYCVIVIWVSAWFKYIDWLVDWNLKKNSHRYPPRFVYSSAISCFQCWKSRSRCLWTIWRWWRNTITTTCRITTACTLLTSRRPRTCYAAGPHYEYDNTWLVINVKKVNSLKRCVRTTVIDSQN